MGKPLRAGPKPALTLRSLDEESLGEASRLLSVAFHGGESLAPTWEAEIGRDLATCCLEGGLSLVARHEGEIVGVTLVSRCSSTQLRVTASGVHPDHRRRGIALSMLSRLVELGRGEGVEELWLEVGAENDAAICLWTSLGFMVTHRLVDLRASRRDFRPRSPHSGLTVRRATVRDVLAHHEVFHAVRPSWSRAPARLLSLARELTTLELVEGEERRAYLLLRGMRIEDLGVEAGGLEFVGPLLEAAFRRHAVLHLPIWPEEDPLTIELLTRGFVPLGASLEMKLMIPRSPPPCE
ncbi:MAG: GNAT family N-acetyltransferase [Planctomycetota bacterium]